LKLSSGCKFIIQTKTGFMAELLGQNLSQKATKTP
jgi:hypothetical protein